MAYEMKDHQARVVLSEVDVVVDGKVIGYIKEKECSVGGSLYHCCLNLPDGDCRLTSLVQGHGDTREDALKNAFVYSIAAAENYLTAVKELEKMVFGEEGEK